MSLGAAIRSGAKWLALGKLGNRLMDFAFGVILARLLTPADFGMIATVAVFTGFVGMFTAGGMGQSLIRAKEADVEDFTAVFTLQLGLGILVYLCFFAAAPFIAQAFHNPVYTDLVRVMALSFLLRPFHVMRTAWLNRQMDFKSRTQIEVSMGLFSGVTASLLAWAGLGVWSLALSGLLNALVQNLWLSLLVPIKTRLNPRRAVMARHMRFGAKIVANDFFSYLNREGRTLLISKLAGAASLGLFNKAESLARLPNQILMQPTMEPLFRALGKTQDDLDQARYLYHRAITLLAAYTLPLYALLWWIAEPFIGVVYGPKWLEAAEPMRILLLMGPALILLYPSSVLLAAQNRLGQEMRAQALNLPIALLAVYIGLNGGLVGVAWAVLASTSLLALHLVLCVKNTLHSSWMELRQALAPGLGMALVNALTLGLLDVFIESWKSEQPILYLLAMSSLGAGTMALLMVYTPFSMLDSEANRWRHGLVRVLQAVKLPVRDIPPRP